MAKQGELGLLLRAAREDRGLTQQEVATRVGVHATTVAKLESGERRGTQARTESVLVRLAQELGLDSNRLLEIAGRRQPDDPRLAERPTMEEFVMTEPTLAPDQRRMLLAVYRSLVDPGE